MDWQGTYTSIFLMALNSAVFGERLYAVVPALFLAIICFSTRFFLKTILLDWLKIDRIKYRIVLMVYLLLCIHSMPAHQSAFFWYNGAVHYLAPNAVLLCLIAFYIRMYIGIKPRLSYVGAILCAVYVGGGNYVTGVSCIMVIGTVSLLLIVGKKVGKYWNIFSVTAIYLTAFAINVLAPGNLHRLGMLGGQKGLMKSFFLSFYQSWADGGTGL